MVLGPAESVGPPLDVPAPSADLVAEAVPLAAALLRAHAQNLAGAKTGVHEVLSERLRAAGISVETQTLPRGREVLLARVRGKEPRAGPVVMATTIKVKALAQRHSILARQKNATAPVRLTTDHLIGRGSLDVLGPLALSALALIALQQSEEQPRRDVLLVVATDDSEGASALAAAISSWPRLADAWVVLSDGGELIEPSVENGPALLALSVAEKGTLQLDLVARGARTLAAMSGREQASARLLTAVQRVVAIDHPLTVTTPSARMLAALGASEGGARGWFQQRPTFFAAWAWLRPAVLVQETGLHALLHNTCALTDFRTHSHEELATGPGFVPDLSSARLDCRLLPGTSPPAFRDQVLLAIDDPKIEMTVRRHESARGSRLDHPALTIIRAQLAREFPRLDTIPWFQATSTSARVFRAHHLPSYGFSPLQVNAEERALRYGPDERVRRVELEAALGRYFRVLAALAH